MIDLRTAKNNLKKLLDAQGKVDKRVSKCFEKAMEDGFGDITLQRWLDACEAQYDHGIEIDNAKTVINDLKEKASKEIKEIDRRLEDLNSEIKKLASKKNRLYNDVWY